jgi:serine/threonine protein kinase
MTEIVNESLNELFDKRLKGKNVNLKRGGSVQTYTLIKSHKSGMKGVVWKAKDDLGETVALKILPESDYYGRSLIDEVTEANKLKSEFFARINFFGDLNIKGIKLSKLYKGIAIEWIEGDPLDKFVKDNIRTCHDFIMLTRGLCSVLSILNNKNLCHDDLHPGNVLLSVVEDPLNHEKFFSLKIIDTGTIKRIDTREFLLNKLREEISTISEYSPDSSKVKILKDRLKWFSPGDHIRIIECLLISANALVNNYHRLDFYERKFVDGLLKFFQATTDSDLSRRLDDPERMIRNIEALFRSCQLEDKQDKPKLSSPFDYISAEMITSDREFADLFSRECPWLEDCQNLEPIYIYGPRGCGKSSVLRWLSFKTILSDPSRHNFSDLREFGIFVSCSVELRSRFWLLSDETIDDLQVPIIRFFSLILVEELFDTLLLMWNQERQGLNDFGLSSSDLDTLTDLIINRLGQKATSIRFQGQNVFAYLKSLIRSLRWKTWSVIQQNQIEPGNPDPALLQDICRYIVDCLNFFKNRYIVFLVDDYSNQRIPNSLQRKLNQTISFAKQGRPLFKVSSEYQGVDLEGIQEGREVVEINVGEKYTGLEKNGHEFLADILNIRLKKAEWQAKIEQLLGISNYTSISNAIGLETKAAPVYYHGIDCIHKLCSGDIALALDLIKKIFENNNVGANSVNKVSPKEQHIAIQNFSHEEVRRIKYIVPFGDEMYGIICYLGALARAVVRNKRSQRHDKAGDPICMTHLDIRISAIQELKTSCDKKLFSIYDLLRSRAILLVLETSRSRISGAVERLQIRKIYLPAFKAPLKRDVPIKIDSKDHLISFLSNPKTFVERELHKADIGPEQLSLAFEESKIKIVDR